jgi:hypothetical protein
MSPMSVSAAFSRCQGLCRGFLLLPLLLLLSLMASAQSAASGDAQPSTLPDLRWQLSPRPWQPAEPSREEMLAHLERGVRAMARLQDADGAIIDPYKLREFQYATPYYAHAVGFLLSLGRAADLRDSALRAMEHATSHFAIGAEAIPDHHGEFYIPALAEALPLYKDIAPAAQWQRWQQRLRAPLMQVIDGFGEHQNNWRTYAMRGEWLRLKQGLAHRDEAVDFIERSWRELQKHRLADSRWSLYLDYSSDPNSQAVEAVGRGNLLGLMTAGYDGPSAPEMRRLLHRATRMSLLTMDANGQAPTNGRTDNHVWNDILYQLCFEMAAETAQADGDLALAGRYRRAASLAFRSAMRWQREDGAFQITKNFFPNELRVGYQPASQWTNYNGAAIIHLAEAIETRHTDIAEQPTPAEIGGYAFANDEKFASAFANAGGMQVMVNLRGEVDPAKYNIYWTPIGIARISRAAWDARLGPSDGVRDSHSREGVTLAPAWKQRDRWVRLADVPERYQGEFTVEFASPALVLATVRYRSRGGSPDFAVRLTLTPDGMLLRVESDTDLSFGLSLPLLEDDGSGSVETEVQGRMARTRFRTAENQPTDEQVFLTLDNSEPIDATADRVLGSAGWLRPLLTDARTVFVYPRSPDDPAADKVLDSMTLTDHGFRSSLGRVDGKLYVGRFAAGGMARELRLADGANPVIEFDEETVFTARHENGRVTALETDRAVRARIHEQTVDMQPHVVWRASGAGNR